MTRAIQHLQDALARADLHTPPYHALQRLTDAVVQAASTTCSGITPNGCA